MIKYTICVLASAVLLALAACPASSASLDNPASIHKMEPAFFKEESPEEPENERIEAALLARAHLIEDCTVTHYDVCETCCGSAGGITASGVRAAPYITCAVDPAMIPLGSDLLVDYGDGELHYYRADDTGTGVLGSHIDLCVSSHAEALDLGVRTADVYWVEMEGRVS